MAIGAVVVEPGLQRTFYGRLRPISEQFIPAALAVGGFSRADTLGFPNAGDVMREFGHWITENTAGRPMFVSDNNGFDWQFVNWYFHAFLDENPSATPRRTWGRSTRGW